MKLLPCSISLKVDMVKLCGGSGVTGDNHFKGLLTGSCSCRWNFRWLHLLTLTGTEYYAWTLPLLSSFSKSTASQSRTVLIPDAGGRRHRHGCPPFTCGGLSSMSSPFRRRGDPSKCGVLSYELNCADDKATTQTDNGTYFVMGINYTDSTFLIGDANISEGWSSPSSVSGDEGG